MGDVTYHTTRIHCIVRNATGTLISAVIDTWAVRVGINIPAVHLAISEEAQASFIKQGEWDINL